MPGGACLSLEPAGLATVCHKGVQASTHPNVLHVTTQAEPAGLTTAAPHGPSVFSWGCQGQGSSACTRPEGFPPRLESSRTLCTQKKGCPAPEAEPSPGPLLGQARPHNLLPLLPPPSPCPGRSHSICQHSSCVFTLVSRKPGRCHCCAWAQSQDTELPAGGSGAEAPCPQTREWHRPLQDPAADRPDFWCRTCEKCEGGCEQEEQRYDSPWPEATAGGQAAPKPANMTQGLG